MSARVRINSRGIKALTAPGSDVDAAVRRAADTAADRARANVRGAGYGPGAAIASSIKVRRSSTTTASGRVRYVVSATHELAQVYEDGSKPHVIRAKKASALHFKYGSKRVIVPTAGTAGAWFAGNGRPLLRAEPRRAGWVLPGAIISFKGYVDHPGTRGLHYMEEALRSIRKQDFLP